MPHFHSVTGTTPRAAVITPKKTCVVASKAVSVNIQATTDAVSSEASIKVMQQLDKEQNVIPCLYRAQFHGSEQRSRQHQ